VANLQSLKLRNCGLRGAAVANVIAHAEISLTHLDLVHNTLKGDTQDESSIPFYTRLAKLTALTDLDLPQHHGVYIAKLRDLYEAVVIYSFFNLILEFCGGETDCVYQIENEPAIKMPFPLWCFCQGERQRDVKLIF
jgi:hypothetical protein